MSCWIKDLFQAAQCPGVVATMKDALGKLEVANTSGDLAALQDGSPDPVRSKQQEQ